MDYILFWQLNPKRIEAFISAYEEKQKIFIEQTNFTAWLNGVYITHAVGSVLSNDHQYMQEPIAFFENEDDKEKKAKREADMFGAYAIMFNNQFQDSKT